MILTVYIILTLLMSVMLSGIIEKAFVAYITNNPTTCISSDIGFFLL